MLESDLILKSQNMHVFCAIYRKFSLLLTIFSLFKSRSTLSEILYTPLTVSRCIQTYVL